MNPTPDRDFLEESEGWIQEKGGGFWGTLGRVASVVVLATQPKVSFGTCVEAVLMGDSVLNSHPGAGNGSATLGL